MCSPVDQMCIDLKIVGTNCQQYAMLDVSLTKISNKYLFVIYQYIIYKYCVKNIH
ncbi:hypothetical protein GCM10007169_34530 [Shewanella fodinae]|nr:hypothetical protein GCM10007169_34530 [Shewanella fodinae]